MSSNFLLKLYLLWYFSLDYFLAMFQYHPFSLSLFYHPLFYACHHHHFLFLPNSSILSNPWFCFCVISVFFFSTHYLMVNIQIFWLQQLFRTSLFPVKHRHLAKININNISWWQSQHFLMISGLSGYTVSSFVFAQFCYWLFW